MMQHMIAHRSERDPARVQQIKEVAVHDVQWILNKVRTSPATMRWPFLTTSFAHCSTWASRSSRLPRGTAAPCFSRRSPLAAPAEAPMWSAWCWRWSKSEMSARPGARWCNWPRFWCVPGLRGAADGLRTITLAWLGMVSCGTARRSGHIVLSCGAVG